MKLVIYSDVLNQHQAPVSDCLWDLTCHEFAFVELKSSDENKGGTEDYSGRPYLLKAWTSSDSYNKALNLAETADCCIFAGIASLPFERRRMKLGLLSFEMGERWLKRGWMSLASPNLLKWLANYHLYGWGRKPLYKLCCSAFCEVDHRALGSFDGKCFKWGYFPTLDAPVEKSASTEVSVMWCGRFIGWKHPELPVLLVARLKQKGYILSLDMFGTGPLENKTKQLADCLEVAPWVQRHGAVTNNEVRSAMRKADVFIISSDRKEGWGVVANESLSASCALVVADTIGSAPYLVEDGVNGLLFKGPSARSSFDNPDMSSLDSLCNKVEWLISHREVFDRIQKNARSGMENLWNPQVAARRLLVLIDKLSNNEGTPFESGPCSKA